MMYNYPSFFPFRRTPFYYGNYTRPVSYPYHNQQKQSSAISHSTKETVLPKQNISPSKAEDTDIFLEVFGIKLYFDDILLICLIFFLYNEGVKDQYLFISLVLLLLS